MTGHHFHPSLLREYDIRGVFGETLFESDAHAIGRSFATMVLRDRAGAAESCVPCVVVGRDGRLSSPALEAALVDGLCSGGVDVLRIGVGPTPMLYFAEATLGSAGTEIAGPGGSASTRPVLADQVSAEKVSAEQVPAEQVVGGIQVTGSHNPGDHNGFKIVRAGRPFFGPDILDLGHVAERGEWTTGPGRVRDIAVIDAYVERLLQGLSGAEHAALEGVRIGWDAGNGAAGPIVERLASRLPGHHELLFTAVDGHFPNHHPDPSDEANLVDLQRLVLQRPLDFGFAFDGDGDRLGVVDGKGRVLWGDRILHIAAQDVLARHPGAAVVADIKASATLFDAIERLGGKPEMWKTGHSHIKSRMKQTGALLGGEMTGHLFFADDYYGFDDALYGAVRMLAATARLGRSITQLRDMMPEPFSTPELRFAVAETRKFAVIGEVLARLRAEGADLVTIDGARVTTADGWWLLRASNTQAMLTARAESTTREGLARLVATIDAQLAASGIVR